MNLQEILAIFAKNREHKFNGIFNDDATRLHDFIRANDIKVIVETGVQFGFSSLLFLATVPNDGLVISIDPALRPFTELIVPRPYYANWIPIQNYSQNVLDGIVQKYKPDLFIHDGHHFYDSMMKEYRSAFPYSRFVASHDITGPKAGTVWEDFKKEKNVQPLIETKSLGLLPGGRK